MTLISIGNKKTFINDTPEQVYIDLLDEYNVINQRKVKNGYVMYCEDEYGDFYIRVISITDDPIFSV